MRIRAERDELVDVLSRAARAVSARSPLPVSQGLLLVVEGGLLQVTGTDGEVTIRTALEVEVGEGGRTVVPARLATEAVRKLPPGAVTVGAVGGEVEISGGGPCFRLREFAVDDFPVLTPPSMEGAIAVSGDVFVAALAQVMVAASHDDARPLLTGVYFEPSPTALRLVATDSYRLAVRDIPAVKAELSGLVPVRALRELARTVAAKELFLAIGAREAMVSSDRGTLTARLIEGTFPNYRQLLPTDSPNRLVVGRDDLLQAIDRASLVAEDHIPVRLQLQEGGVELSVTRQDVGGESEYVVGKYEGEEMTIAFNGRYLNDGVSAAEGDQVMIEVVDPLKPGVVRGAATTDYVYLLMPVRL